MPDAVEALLKSLNTSTRARAAAWDAVYSVQDDKQAEEMLRSLPFSDDIKARLWDARRGIDPEPFAAPSVESSEQTGPQGSALRRFASNAAEMLNPITAVKGIAQAVMNPIDTGKALYGAQAGQFGQAREAFGQGRYAEAFGHGLAGSVPLVGPIAAEAGEQIASGDVAGGLGKTTGLLAPLGVRPVMQAARAGVPSRVRQAAATRMEAGAAERVADVMSPKVGRNKIRIGNQAETIAPRMARDLVDDGAPLTREGFQAQVQTRRAAAEQSLDAAADARLNAQSFETQPVIDALLERRQRLTAEAVEAERRIPEYRGDGARVARPDTEFKASGAIDTADVPPQGRGYRTTGEEPGRFASEPTRAGVPLGRDVQPHHNAARIAEIDAAIKEVQALGPVARYEAIRRIRQSYDPVAKAKYAPSVTEDFLAKSGQASGAADVTGVLREHLAQWDPATAAANADYHIYRTADDALEAVRQVERSRPRVGRQIMARLTGTLFGGQQAGVPGAVAGYVGAPLVDQMLSSGMTTKLKTARLMQNLADAIRAGDTGRVDGLLVLIRRELKTTVPVQAGRLTSPSESQRPTVPVISGP